ncbi:MAG: YdcF family protein [Ilumatobacteraceae bacterium]
MTIDTGSTSRRDETPVCPIAVGRHAGPRRRWGAGRRIAVGLLLVVGLLVGYYLVSLYQVWSTGRADLARPVDAIVVMGAAQYDGDPSPVLAARLDHVVDLWGQGVAERVVVTGGKQPEDRFTEAEASAVYLNERGVPAEAIVLEDDSRSTFEALQGVSALLGARGLDEVLIVTDPYHSLRSRIIAEDVGLQAWTSPTPSSVVDGSESFQRHLQEAAGVAIGRIIGFDSL